jgi:hypothetical protein
MKNQVTILGILILSLFSCNSKTDKVKELCDTYNKQVPIILDESTTLKGVTCTDVFFSFHYELNASDLDLAAIIYTEETIKKSLMNSVNKITEFEELRKSGHNLGYIYNDLNKKPIISILFSVNSKGEYEYNKELSERVQNKFETNSKSHSSPTSNTINNNWKNSEHGISLQLPEDFIEEALDETNMILNAYSADLNRRIEIVFSDDYSFKVLSNEDFAENQKKEQMLSALEILYDEIKINIWEPKFHTKFGTLTHFVYTGNLIETGNRQTSIISQFIKNGKLYTIKAICLPEDIREFHIMMRKIYDSIKWKNK